MDSDNFPDWEHEGMSTDQTRQLEMLVQIAQLLATLDLDKVLLQIIELTTDTVGAVRGSFLLLDEKGETLQRFIAARDYAPEIKPVVSSRVLHEGLAGWVLTNAQSALIEDTLTDPRWITLEYDTEPKRVRSAICVPFFVGDLPRGVMTLEHPDPGHFGPGDLRIVEAAANQAAAALRNAQLFDRVQSQQQQLEGVLNSISEALFVVDGDWRLRLVNPEALVLIGAEAGDVIERSLTELSEKYNNPFFALIVENIQTGAVDDGKLSFELRDDLSGHDYAVNVAMLNQGNPLEQTYVIALHDVTSLKDLNRLKTHMIQMASHDLKNPIGVLRGYLDVIRGDANRGVLPDPVFIDNMYKSIARMENLVVNLLDIQRAEHDSPLKRELINPHDLLQAALEDMMPSANRHKHTVVLNIQKDMKPFKGDVVRLREVIDNLIENAIKYTPDGGTITVTAFTESERFGFHVEDTGYGVPASEQPHVFEPYFRAEQKATKMVSGTGIGLSLVKEIIERHGGQVWFASKEGEGSTFGFWLPLLT